MKARLQIGILSSYFCYLGLEIDYCFLRVIQLMLISTYNRQLIINLLVSLVFLIFVFITSLFGKIS